MDLQLTNNADAAPEPSETPEFEPAAPAPPREMSPSTIAPWGRPYYPPVPVTPVPPEVRFRAFSAVMSAGDDTPVHRDDVEPLAGAMDWPYSVVRANPVGARAG